LIGLPCLRLKGIFVAIVTFAVHLILTPILMWGEEWTMGSMGFPVPSPHFFGYAFSPHKLVPWYYLGLGLFVVLLFFIYKVIHSPLGLAFVALRDGEEFAKSLGVNDFKYRLIVFGISSFITGIAGAFYAHYYAMLAPSILGLDTFLLVLIMVMFGGLGKFPGAVLGAFSITVLNELLRPAGVLRFVILGIIVIATMIYMPKGLMGIPESFNRIMKKIFPGRGKVQQDSSGIG
jgi:branched-chain amino acid transport system permease protein